MAVWDDRHGSWQTTGGYGTGIRRFEPCQLRFSRTGNSLHINTL